MNITQINRFILGLFYDENGLEPTEISNGRMTPQEVMKIALPIAHEEGWIRDEGEIITGPQEPVLWKYKHKKELIWIVWFSFLKIDGIEIDERLDRGLAYIEIDDETGKVIKKCLHPKFSKDSSNE